MSSGTSTNRDGDLASGRPTPPINCIDVVVAHRNAETRDKLVESVRSLGHEVRRVCRDTPELLETCHAKVPDLIMSGIELDGGDAIDALVAISEREPTPAIVVTPKESLLNVEMALRDHVMAYLVEPVDVDQIKPTIYLVCERFKQYEMLKAENDDLKQTLADRKVIEQAKGILMGQFDLAEGEAFRRLQKLAQSKRAKLARIAEAVIDAAKRPDA